MNPIQVALLTIFHPMDGFVQLKANRERFSYIPTLVIAALFLVVRVLSLYLMHYSVGSVEPQYINVGLEVATVLCISLSWNVVHYAVTTISNGECKMREVFAGFAYSFIPFVLFMIPISLLSHLYSQESAGTITVLQDIVWAYCFFQVFLSIMSMNDYPLGTTIGIIVLTFIGIALCWVLIMLIYGFTGQLVKTAIKVIEEIINIYIS